MVQEHRVHSLTNGIVAAEREREVADAAADFGARAGSLDLAGGFYEVDRVFVVFLDTGGNGENIGVENDVRRVVAYFFDKDLVGALADVYFSLNRIGLALFVESHHHNGRTETAADFGLADKLADAFFHGNGIDDTFPLQAFQARFDHLKLG